MLPKIRQQNNNGGNINAEIKDELNQEKILADISNQAAEEYDNLINPSNKANQDQKRKRPRYQGMSEKDYVSDEEDEKDDLLEISTGENKNKIIEENESENGDEESIDEAENLIREAKEALEDPENDDLSESYEEIDIMNTAFYGELPQGNEKKKKKEKKSDRKNAKKSDKKSGPAKQKKEEDLTRIEESLEPVNDLNVAVQKIDPRIKPSGGKKFLSSLAFYSGKFLGKVFGTVATLLNAITFGIFTGSNSLTGSWRRLFGQSFSQKKKNRKNIPGWDGAQFEERPENDDEVNIDFRRVPDVWSYPIAVEGDTTEGKGDKAKRKQRPPIISVYVAQSSNRYTADEGLLSGHSGIGIEYSRKSAKTGRWERYNLRYGFGIGGGMGGGHAMNATLSYNNATIPGQLKNEKGDVYSVSRSFTATPKQVNDVLRASETYADRGGYNQYTRNCTTFAKEMVVDVAKIRGAAPIFEKDEVYAHNKADAGMLGAGILAPYYKAEMQNKFAKMGTKDDMTYQGFGNKLFTQEDYKRYNKSIGFWSGRMNMTDSPNGAAENMYRMEGGSSGKLGAGLEAVVNGHTKRTASMNEIKENLPAKIGNLMTALADITPRADLYGGKSAGFQSVMDTLNTDNINDALDDMPMDEEELNQSKQTDLIRYRSVFTDIIDGCNTLLFKYYHNDKRVQEVVLEILDWASHGIRNIDDAYANTSNKDNEEPEKGLENLKADFSGKKYVIRYTDQNGRSKRVAMTPSHYESYLQIYKTPEKAITQYARYVTLYTQYWDHDAFGKDDPRFKEFEKLERIDQLAEDFDNSHKYMLEKAEYSQQDVDYAFSLYKKENQGNLSFYKLDQSDPNNPAATIPTEHSQASASNVYQMLILKSIFGDMKSRFDQQFKKQKATKNDVVTWLDNDITDEIDDNRDGMKMVLRGIKKSIKKPDKKKIKRKTANLLTRWLAQLTSGITNKNAFESVAKDVTTGKSQVVARINSLIDDIMSEELQGPEL